MFKRSLALAVAGLVAAATPIISKHAPVPTSLGIENTRRSRTVSAYSSPFGHKRKGPGWTPAHVKRMAKKARNQKRHRKATKGGAA